MLYAAPLRGPPTSTRSPYQIPLVIVIRLPPPTVTIRGLCRGCQRCPTCDRFYDGEGMCRINPIHGVGNRRGKPLACPSQSPLGCVVARDRRDLALQLPPLHLSVSSPRAHCGTP